MAWAIAFGPAANDLQINHWPREEPDIGAGSEGQAMLPPGNLGTQ